MKPMSRRGPSIGFPCQNSSPVVGDLQSADDPKQRALSRSARTNYADNRPRCDLEIDFAQSSRPVFELFADFPEAQHTQPL